MFYSVMAQTFRGVVSLVDLYTMDSLQLLFLSLSFHRHRSRLLAGRQPLSSRSWRAARTFAAAPLSNHTDGNVRLPKGGEEIFLSPHTYCKCTPPPPPPPISALTLLQCRRFQRLVACRPFALEQVQLVIRGRTGNMPLANEC